MCIELNQLTLCTCETREKLEDLDRYWILYRKGRNREYMIMGEPIGRDYLALDNYGLILDKILLSLNSGNVFDKKIDHIESDLLHIFIKPDSKKDHWVFSFEFCEGKWISHSFEPFEADNGFRELKFGDLEL